MGPFFSTFGVVIPDLEGIGFSYRRSSGKRKHEKAGEKKNFNFGRAELVRSKLRKLFLQKKKKKE